MSKTQSYFGIQEVTEIYDNANTESEDELEQKGREMLEDAYAAANAMDVTFKSNENYDIGDYVGTKELLYRYSDQGRNHKENCKSKKQRH